MAWSSLVAPRPIALISTVNEDGVPNIAPVSSLACLANVPPMVGISFGERKSGVKNTLANILATGEFVANLVSGEMRQAMITAATPTPVADDFARLELTPVRMSTVKCARIAESPASFACRMIKTIDLAPARVTYLVAEVVEVHIDDRFVKDGKFFAYDANLIGSLGIEDYVTLEGEAFWMARTWD